MSVIKQPPRVDDVGSLFVKAGAITEPQLDRARRIVAKLKERKSVGELLVELGQLSREDHDRIVAEHRGTLSLVGILHEQGVLDDDGLALFDKAKASRPDVEERVLLVDEGGCPEIKFLEALEIKYQIPVVYPEVALVDRQYLAEVSIPYLIRMESLPYRIVDGKLDVIMADPLDQTAIHTLEEALGHPISPCSAPRELILQTLETLDAWRGSPEAAPDSKVQYHELTQDTDEEEPGEEVVQLVDQVLVRAIQLGASDVHFEPTPNRLRIRARVDGVMRVLNDLPPDFAARLASRLKILGGADIAERRLHQDGRIVVKIEGKEVDIRVSTYASIFGEAIVLRILDRGKGLVPLEELGFEPAVMRLLRDVALRASSEMTLVTGPTGSGKTTTLYSFVDHILDDRIKVITAEDPVEYVLPGVTQCSINQKTGPTFADSLRAILRQDPDVIVVGEIRDPTTAGLAVEAALTGHRVFSTFHTEDAVGSIVRLLEMGVEPFLVSSTLGCVVAQRLVRRLCKVCKELGDASSNDLRFLGLSRTDVSDVPTFTAAGCEQCGGTGYRGRLGVHEVMLPNDEFRDAILDRASSKDLRRLARGLTGYLSLQEDGVLKAISGETTFEALANTLPRDENARPVSVLRRIGAHRRTA